MNTEGIPTNITSMTDVDFVREYDGSTSGVTVYNNRESDWNMVTDMMEQGWKVTAVTDL